MLNYCLLYKFLVVTGAALFGESLVSGVQLLESPACTGAKDSCHNDTDCLHRVMYLHSTCVTGSCQPQCKIAVLNLYETLPGRKLLETDLSCMSGVESEMAQCGLVPTRIPMHCSLARLVCEADPLCRNDIDIFESLCHDSDPTELGECTDQCGTYLAKVFRKSKGAALRSCTCWKHDPLCNHLKETLLDKCLLKAGSIVDNTNNNKTPKNGETPTEEEKTPAAPEPKSNPENAATSTEATKLSVVFPVIFLVICKKD